MYLSFDVGGTFIKYGVVDDEGTIIEKSKVATPQEENAFVATLTELSVAYKEKYPIEGIGLSVCGVPDENGVVVNFGALTHLYGLPLQARLSTLTGLSVAVENDANAAAIAEKWLGGAQTMKNYLVIALGTGVGGGIVINNEIYRGAHGTAGEFGWALTNGITPVGELEEVSQNFKSAAVLGLLNNYNKAQNSVTHGDFTELSEAKEVVDLVEAGDVTASIIFDEFLTNLTLNLMNLTSFFDPEAILIGGGISANEYFMDKLQEKWTLLISRHFALNRMRTQNRLPVIRQAALRNDAGLLGAAFTIKSKIRK